MNQGWRTVIVETGTDLSLRNSMLVPDGDEERGIPLYQVRKLMITSERATISAGVLVRLAQDNIDVILCDRKHMPAASLTGLNSHANVAGSLIEQAKWTEENKEALWVTLSSAKILRQYDLLVRLGLVEEQLHPAREAGFDPAVWSRREGAVARFYFHRLFGDRFRRHASDDTNGALNYGYSILVSAVARAVVSHGYSTALGLHHCSGDNAFNLAYDIVEPFRPFADEIVYAHRGQALNSAYREELIAVVRRKCRFHGGETTVGAAIDAFVLEVLKAAAVSDQQIGVAEFV